jgi:hypothetical protein
MVKLLTNVQSYSYQRSGGLAERQHKTSTERATNAFSYLQCTVLDPINIHSTFYIYGCVQEKLEDASISLANSGSLKRTVHFDSHQLLDLPGWDPHWGAMRYIDRAGV